MTPFVEALQGRLPGKVRADSAALDTFQTDGLTAFHERPLAVVFAETQADVVQAVRLLSLIHI